MNIPMVKVPTFKMTLPFTKEEVKFRPYIVKEEKILIMARESDDNNAMIEAVGDIVKECTFGKIDINTTPMFDVQYAFLQIRGKSIGEKFDFNCVCGGCKTTIPVSVDISEFELSVTPGHTNKIQLDENFTVLMKYPSIKSFIKLYFDDSENAIYDVVADCIDTIYTEDEVYKNDGTDNKLFLEFLENLTVKQFENLERFFVTMPIIQKDIQFDCPKCQEKNRTLINGISNFFG